MTRHSARFIGATFLLGLLAAASCLLAGQSKQPTPAPKKAKQDGPSKTAAVTTQNFPLNRVVVKVGGQAATAADVEYAGHFMPREIQDEVEIEGNRKPMGDEYARMVTLTQEAARRHLEDSLEFRRHMALARMQWLSQAEFKSLNDQAPVTDDEIKEYYAAHRAAYAQLLIQEVSIRKKAANADAAEPGLSEADANAQAGAIRHALEAGQDFSKVAAEFQQTGVVYFDPKPHLISRASFSAKISSQLFNLKDSVLSETFESPNAVYFVQVLKHSQPDLSDVRQAIETRIQTQKISDAIASLEKRASVWMDPVYFAPLNPEEKSEHETPGAADTHDQRP